MWPFPVATESSSYLGFPWWDQGLERPNLRIKNPQVAAIAVRHGSGREDDRRATLRRNLKRAVCVRFRWWAPGDSNPEPAD